MRSFIGESLYSHALRNYPRTFNLWNPVCCKPNKTMIFVCSS